MSTGQCVIVYHCEGRCLSPTIHVGQSVPFFVVVDVVDIVAVVDVVAAVDAVNGVCT